MFAACVGGKQETGDGGCLQLLLGVDRETGDGGHLQLVCGVDRKQVMEGVCSVCVG